MTKVFYDILKDICTIAHITAPKTFSSTKRPYVELKQYIQDVVDEICSGYEWTFREKVYSFTPDSNSTIPATRPYYTLPDGCEAKFILHNGIRRANFIPPLTYVPIAQLDIIPLNIGKPIYYSVYNDKITLWLIPDDSYPTTIKYLTSFYAKNPTTVKNSSASGQKVLSVNSTVGFTAGSSITISEGTATEETAVISTFNLSTLGLTTNLVNTHASGVSLYSMKHNLALENDTCIIPDRWTKAIIWGAYSLYRLNFKGIADPKYIAADKQFKKYVRKMKSEHGYGDDVSTIFSIGKNTFSGTKAIVYGFKNAGLYN